MSGRGLKFSVAAGIIVLALGYLVYTGVEEAKAYYLTIPELLERAPTVYGDRVRVAGEVVPGSINKYKDGSLEFQIAQGEKAIKVRYKGIVPDIFRDEVEAIVEGELTPQGIFQADVLLAKCPTKYESLPEEYKKGETI